MTFVEFIDSIWGTIPTSPEGRRRAEQQWRQLELAAHRRINLSRLDPSQPEERDWWSCVDLEALEEERRRWTDARQEKAAER